MVSQAGPQQSTAIGDPSDTAVFLAPTALADEPGADAASQLVAADNAPFAVADASQVSSPVKPSDAYLLQSALSASPVPLTDVPLVWPAGLIPVGKLVGVFWLYIDETGKVDRFVSDGPDLPPQLEEVSRSAFLATRFKPGQVDGLAVKALIKIEVEFDNRPPNAPAPHVASEQLL